ncbi:MAG: 6-phosphogluconolactonase [Verrucomicrobia bacterium]|nr:6-phosphogluconolactonase [Verrucomicrobiota bacterium]
MGNFEITRCLSPRELADTVAQRWLEELAARTNASANYTAALSGGRIAKDFFSAVAEQAARRSELFRGVHFFWADERCVPPDHNESNFASAQLLLFTPLGIPPVQIHRVRGEVEPERAAEEAATELRRFATTTRDGQPVLDMVFLGMGEDGHVASLFPGEPPECLTDARVYRAVTAGKPPPRRITLGYPVLAAAQKVWVLASGAGKEEALRQSLLPDGATPLANVLRARQSTVIFSDLG